MRSSVIGLWLMGPTPPIPSMQSRTSRCRRPLTHKLMFHPLRPYSCSGSQGSEFDPHPAGPRHLRHGWLRWTRQHVGKLASMQVCEYTSVQECKCARCKCASVQVCKCVKYGLVNMWVGPAVLQVGVRSEIFVPVVHAILARPPVQPETCGLQMARYRTLSE